MSLKAEAVESASRAANKPQRKEDSARSPARRVHVTIGRHLQGTSIHLPVLRSPQNPFDSYCSGNSLRRTLGGPAGSGLTSVFPPVDTFEAEAGVTGVNELDGLVGNIV